jgi:putative salt-induced outer membrane protein YdiY
MLVFFAHALAAALHGAGAASDLPAPDELRLEIPGQPAATPPAEPTVPAESATGWSQGWTGTVELGLNGADGNTELLALRAGAAARRQTDRYDTKADATFSYATQSGDETANRFEANLRNDWLIPGSRWRFFADAKFESDEFTAWDQRLSGHAGVGYQFIKTEKTSLLGRVGVGASKEFGSEDDDVVPEGLLGADFEHKFTDTQSIVASANYYPQLDDLEEFRADLTAAYQIVVDPSNSLTLKLGIEDRYDSTPGDGFKENDISYFALLSWSF